MIDRENGKEEHIVDFESMTKKELIQYINKLINQRAFSYDDRMKLLIIDKAPFTLWACDKDFKIRLWACQCENMYGYSKEEAIGNNYLSMFVAADEQPASKTDCLDIIENGTPFYNCVAQDEGRKGKRSIITNCFRVRDVETDEFLQAEIGLDISNLDSEKEKYDKVIRESKLLYQTKCELYEKVDALIRTFINRANIFEDKLVENESKALAAHRRQEYINGEGPLKTGIEKERQVFDNSINDIRCAIEAMSSSQDRNNLEIAISELGHKLDLCFRRLDLDADELFDNIQSACDFTINKNQPENSREDIMNNSDAKRFRIALSFPGEYRDNVISSIAERLAKKFGREKILYDLFHQAEFARRDLDIYLQNLYRNESDLIVVFLCKDYDLKPWCGVEWRAIRDLTNNKADRDRVMLIQVGDGEVEGILSTVDGHVTANSSNVESVTNDIIKRYGLNKTLHP